ncbi:ABC transporter ATP-binding protein [Methylotetracoccus oryzae]|uniref:ABC transporter ATP-binding protein n=1 Tax=Methylotetracoccus oryzae TaxID=1919059 RepID=UPI0013A562CF|nr:ABC transporter ATP-binding protein [Methylotetracoccus oryzae]
MRVETPTAVRLEGVVRRYGELEAVRGIDLTIGRGDFFGLLGPNGAGKTTTLAMICGLIDPTRGRILIEGDARRPLAGATKRKLGLVPQEFAFYPTLTARENLAFFGRIYGLAGHRLRERIDAVLNIAQLQERDREPITHYSSGMKRRLNIAIGLLHEPEILILDEPTVGVDAQSRSAILETLRKLNRDGTTVLYSTHYMEEAERLCNRVAIIDQGRVMATDAPRELVRALAAGLIELQLGVPATADFLTSLRQLGTVELPGPDAMTLTVSSLQPEVALPELLGLAQAAGLPIRRLHLLEPNLEAVFLALTGRQLRD